MIFVAKRPAWYGWTLDLNAGPYMQIQSNETAIGKLLCFQCKLQANNEIANHLLT